MQRAPRQVRAAVVLKLPRFPHDHDGTKATGHRERSRDGRSLFVSCRLPHAAAGRRWRLAGKLARRGEFLPAAVPAHHCPPWPGETVDRAEVASRRVAHAAARANRRAIVEAPTARRRADRYVVEKTHFLKGPGCRTKNPDGRRSWPRSLGPASDMLRRRCARSPSRHRLVVVAAPLGRGEDGGRPGVVRLGLARAGGHRSPAG